MNKNSENQELLKLATKNMPMNQEVAKNEIEKNTYKLSEMKKN